MRYIDLSHVMKNGMPAYPGDTMVNITSFSPGPDLHGNTLHCSMHNGTHIDAPGHMRTGGKRICDIALDSLIGSAILIDTRGRKEIGVDALNGVSLERGAIVLIYTGHDKLFHSKEYYESYPAFTQEFAQELVKAGVKMVGMDSPSPDYFPFIVHKLLFSHDILIIENLTNLDQLLGKKFEVIALPINIQAEGALARVIARVEKSTEIAQDALSANPKLKAIFDEVTKKYEDDLRKLSKN